MKSFLLLLILSFSAFSQTTNINGKLKVNSTTKGSQPCPVMTNVQMLSIASPDHGDCVFNYDLKALHTWNAFPGEWTMSGSGGGLSEWETATGYEVGDIIHESGRIYKALELHTSGTFATDLTAAKWVLISDELLTKNQIDSTSSAIKEIQVPHKQFTSTASGKVLQETGNKNRLENPGFEATTVNSGWTSNVTSTATATISTETVAPIEGKKSLIYSCAGGASGGTCTLSQDVATAYALQGLASIFIESDSPTGVKFYNRVNAANSLSVNVDTITASIRKIPFVLGTTSSGLAVEIAVAAAQTIEVILDEGFTGAQDVKQDTDSSRIAGESYFAGTASCDWPRNSATVGSFTATAACPGPTIVTPTTMGTWATTDSNLPKQTITNLPAGRYKATFTFASGAGATSRNVVAITDGTTTCEPVEIEQSTSLNGSTVSCSFTYTSSGDRNFELVGASNTSTIYIYNGQTAPRASVKFQLEYFGSGSTYSSTNADTDWATCGHTTSSFTGFGTVTNIETQCKRQGGDLLMKGKFTSGVSTAVEARLNLVFNGVALTSKNTSVIPTLQLAGHAGRGLASASSNNLSTLIEPSVGYFTFGMYSNASYFATTKRNGSEIVASGEVITFNARIPISTFENSNLIIANLSGLESCTDSYECTDTFSARMSSTGVIEAGSENIDWINGDCTNASPAVCTLKTGLNGSSQNITVPMVCHLTNSVTGEASSGNIVSTTTTISVQLQSNLKQALHVSCRKTGVDYIGKTAKAVASDQNVRSIGSVGVDIQSVYFGSGADCNTVCSVDPCSICTRLAGAKITAVNFVSTGIYRAAGIDGTKYSCSGAGDSAVIYSVKSSSTTSYVQVGAAGVNIARATLTCIGIP